MHVYGHGLVLTGYESYHNEIEKNDLLGSKNCQRLMITLNETYKAAQKLFPRWQRYAKLTAVLVAAKFTRNN